jgi:hypothetical protein
MRRLRLSSASAADTQWQDTTPMPLCEPWTVPAVTGQVRDPRRQHEPPFEQITQGLEMRELESQTVFDQLFGSLPRR